MLQEQGLEFGAGFTAGEEACGEDFCVIEHETIACFEVRGDFSEGTVGKLAALPVNNRDWLRLAAGCWAINSGGR